jgi:hypothetical protein
MIYLTRGTVDLHLTLQLVGLALIISPFVYRYRNSDKEFHGYYVFSFVIGIALIVIAYIYYP